MMRFLQFSLVSSRFLVLLRCAFLIFSFISTCLMVSASYIPKYSKVSFSLSILIFSWFVSSISTVMCRFQLFIISMVHFSMLNSISMSWLYILIVCIRVSNSFSFLANSFMQSLYIRWLIFSCDLVSWYLSVHFLSMWLIGIIAVISIKGDSESPLKIPLRIFTSVKLFLAAVNSTFQFSMVFSINSTTSPDILYILKQSIIQLCEAKSYAFLLSIRFFCLALFSWSTYSSSPVPQVQLEHPFCSLEISLRLIR